VEGCRIAAVCDNSATARQRASVNGVAVFSEVEEMLERETLDAVSICTPPNTHLSLSSACLERGVHVLCEKPLAVDLNSATKLVARARRSSAELFLATKFRYVPEVRIARDRILAGDIGEPLLFEIEFSSRVDMSQRWNSRREVSGGGVIIDNGCHALDLAGYLFGGIQRVLAIRVPTVQALGVEDSAVLLVSTRSGLPGQICLSWSMDSQRDTYLRVRGSQGNVRVGWRESHLHRGVDGRQEVVRLGGGYDKVKAHRGMMHACMDAMTGRGASWISYDECLATAAAVDAAYRSLETGQWQEVLSAAELALTAGAPASR